MTRKLRLKQSVKEALIALAIFSGIMFEFWRTVLFGYPSDLETGFAMGLSVSFIVFVLKGGKK